MQKIFNCYAIYKRTMFFHISIKVQQKKLIDNKNNRIKKRKKIKMAIKERCSINKVF